MKLKPIQHIDDVEIPVIEITEGWAAESIGSLAEADDAFAYLMSACAGIEFQIDMELTKPKPWNEQWLAKARCALKYKKAALQIVNQRRSTINDANRRKCNENRDRKLIEYIRANVPDRTFLEWTRGSGMLDPSID